MKHFQLPAILAAVAVAWAWCLPVTPAYGQDDFEDRIAAEQEEGVELLARGPVHEAFAEPIVDNPEGTLIISLQPPEAIDEVPPEYKPEGDNVIWIPGYWAWEDERKDFIWISGIWRNIPPGQRWVPGYWTEVSEGYQWVPGFWMTEEEEEIVYYPTPPESLEEGPTVEAPDESHFWVPGVWTYETDWRWRPGYWAEYQPDWVWVPARWVWSPNGCVYLTGYWDYQPTYRGNLFAPVYFSQPVYQTVGYRYTPWYALRTSNLFVHFWVRPNYRHYYFGNFYDPIYANRYGFRSWTNWSHGHRHWDPILTYNRVRYQREGIDYVQRIDRWHNYFATNERYRPAVTVRQQINLVNNINIQDNDVINRINIGSPLRELARSENLAVRLTRVEDRQREVFAERASQIRDIHRARLQEERRDSRERLADVREGNRERGPTGRTKIPRVEVADLTGARDAATRARVPDRLDPARGATDRARDAVGRARDTADRARDTAERTRDAATETARDAAGRARDAATDRTRDALDRTRDTAADRARDAAGRARDSATDAARDAAGRARDTAAERARDTVDRTRDTAADRARDTADRARDTATDRARDAASRARDVTDRTGDPLDRTGRGAAAERALEGTPGRTAADRALDRTPGRSAADRALDAGPGRTAAERALDRTPGRTAAERALDAGPGRTAADRAAAARDSALERAGIDRGALDRGPRTGAGADRTPTPGLGAGQDRPGRSGALDLNRPSTERARVDDSRGVIPRSRPGASLEDGAPARPGRGLDELRGGGSLRGTTGGDMRGAAVRPGSRSPTEGLRDLDRGRSAFGGSINDAPGSTVRSRTPSPYRGENDRPGGLDGLGAAAARREALRPSAGGAEVRGTAPGIGPGFDRSPSTARPAGRRAPTGLDLDRVRGADRAGGRDIPAERPSGLGVGNALNTPDVGGPGRGSAGPSRRLDRPTSDGPGAGGPDDRARGRGARDR